MTEKGSINDGIWRPIWTAGWQWPWVVLLAAMLGVNFLGADRVLFGSLVLVAGPALAVGGVGYVNREYPDVLETGTTRVQTAVLELVQFHEEETPVYSIRNGSGSVRRVQPSKEYDLTTLALGESVLVIHDEATVNLHNLKYEVGQGMTEIPYDRISTVDYEDGIVRVHTSDESEHSYRSPQKPGDALSEIRDRLRADERDAVADR